MLKKPVELWLALLAVAVITAVYLPVMVKFGTAPASGGLFGHALGVAGFALMLLTETLYSLRKRARRATWGSMAGWLRFHIFTGLVGPYMVVLHTAWQFNGLAGVVTLLTAVVVISGFIGRYIYTAIPRTTGGAELAAQELEQQIISAEAELQHWLATVPEKSRGTSQHLAALSEIPQNSLLLVVGRVFLEWGYRRRWQRERKRLAGLAQNQARALEQLLNRRRALRRQVISLATARRMLALWHAIHVPLGMVLFATAFIHIGAALHYATLLRK